MVTRGGQALYHIRAYLAAHAEGGTTSLAWAFDVYDAERKRAFRLRGEERAAAAGSWAAANDAMLRRIASTSIAQLMTFIAADRTPARGRRGRRPAGAGRPATISGRSGRHLRSSRHRHRPRRRPPVPLPPRARLRQRDPPGLAYSVSTG